MGDRRGRIDRPPAVEPEARPGAVAPFPIERRVDLFALHPGPAVGQPVTRFGIAAIGDERDPFAIGHGAIGDRMRVKQGFMPGTFAVEGEIVTAMSDLDEATGMVDPADRARHLYRNLARAGPDGGLDRVFRKQMQDVRQQQLLMLLLVMAAQPHQIARFLGQVG